MSRPLESCPSWDRLVAIRDTRQGEDPPGWSDALQHARQCPSCRREAFAADPTLLFQRLPEPELDDFELDAIKRSVRAMRSGSRLAQKPQPRWVRWAAAAIIVGALGSLRGGPLSESSIELLVDRAIEQPAAFDGDAILGALPLVEEADPDFGPIIQLENEIVSMVLVKAIAGAEGVS